MGMLCLRENAKKEEIDHHPWQGLAGFYKNQEPPIAEFIAKGRGKQFFAKPAGSVGTAIPYSKIQTWSTARGRMTSAPSTREKRSRRETALLCHDFPVT